MSKDKDRVSYMQMLFLDDDGNARHTNQRAAMDTNALTWAAFRSYRRLEVDKASAKFLLDYHDANGDLADTILLDASGFAAITGQKAKQAGHYRKLDAAYWAAAQKRYAKEKAA